MSAVSQLIKVSYKDRTNYVSELGGDVMGIPLIHPWGPTGELLVLNEQQFYETYPEEFLSSAVFSAHPEWLHSYATVKQAFDNGIKQVEVYGLCPACRKTPVNDLYICVDPTTKVVSLSTESSAQNKVYKLSPKYAGVPSVQFGIGVELNGSNDTGLDYDYIISARAFKELESRQVEDTYHEGVDAIYSEYYTGLFSSEQVINGEDNSIEAILESSQMIKCERISERVVGVRPQEPTSELILGEAKAIDSDSSSFENVSKVVSFQKTDYYKWFSDMRTSRATLLVSPFATDILNDQVVSTACSAQDRIAVVGANVNNSISLTTAKQFLSSQKSMTHMFATGVFAKEQVDVNGIKVIANCVGGFVGRTAAIASQYKTNQSASAFTYGSYIGTLKESLSFDDALEVHELGLGSVINDINGPLIWNVRTLYGNQNSYFAKLNVIRVLAEILRQIFPICLQAIHTDAAANEQTASDYEVKFTNILDYEVSQGNIKSDSVAVCTGSINSDKNTKGGKIFNLLLAIHFIGLVEKVNISVVATDSSVSAEIL